MIFTPGVNHSPPQKDNLTPSMTIPKNIPAPTHIQKDQGLRDAIATPETPVIMADISPPQTPPSPTPIPILPNTPPHRKREEIAPTKKSSESRALTRLLSHNNEGYKEPIQISLNDSQNETNLRRSSRNK